MPWKPPTLRAPQAYAWAGGSSRRWRKFRERHLRQEPLCRLCLGIDGKIVAAREVDHIVPVSKGGAMWDPRNVQSLCHDHHAAKTTSERTGQPARPKIRFGPDGLPLPGQNHPWSDPK